MDTTARLAVSLRNVLPRLAVLAALQAILIAHGALQRGVAMVFSEVVCEALLGALAPRAVVVAQPAACAARLLCPVLERGQHSRQHARLVDLHDGVIAPDVNRVDEELGHRNVTETLRQLRVEPRIKVHILDENLLLQNIKDLPHCLTVVIGLAHRVDRGHIQHDFSVALLVVEALQQLRCELLLCFLQHAKRGPDSIFLAANCSCVEHVAIVAQGMNCVRRARGQAVLQLGPLARALLQQALAVRGLDVGEAFSDGLDLHGRIRDEQPLAVQQGLCAQKHLVDVHVLLLDLLLTLRGLDLGGLGLGGKDNGLRGPRTHLDAGPVWHVALACRPHRFG
eukprot:m.14561 g.14561  ORF g.14561 m.14561 type:complete len:338 (+) comp2947_c0_seq1:95-1108(+)